ncbi:MAG: HDOD domain-containing protein [Planctomycetes bacterium]|nr:HDOD domain-containing protein [Planctomycetota bacterium]
MTRSILFVDDEPNILSGLRRMLRSQRHAWAMEFAESGPAAIAMLERGRFDAIVSDMRMPGMTGLQLLEEVRKRFPHVVRIMLTGQCDEESAMRALRVSHRMLNKPCDAEFLKATVADVFSFNDLLGNETLVRLVNSKERLPSMPALYTAVLKELDSVEPSLDKIGELICRDLAMYAKIIHVANCCFFGLPTQIDSPKQAIQVLGLEMLRVLVLAVGIFASFREPAGAFSLEGLWDHSMLTSALAREIARSEHLGPGAVEHTAVAGLLHDVGKLVLVESMPEAYRDLLVRAAATQKLPWEAEREELGASHAEVGACLLNLWGFPMGVIEAIAWHHRPSACPRIALGPLTAVHVANVLTVQNEAPPRDVLDRDYLARLNLLHKAPRWQELWENLQEKSHST